MGYNKLNNCIYLHKQELLGLNQFIMITTINRANYFNSITNLYYLLIQADGRVDDKEIKMGEFMIEQEKFDVSEFYRNLELLKDQDKEELTKGCIITLNKCDYNHQVRCIAWMSMIANSDGFMAPEEWKLIYRIYYKELALKLSDILDVQRQLPKLY